MEANNGVPVNIHELHKLQKERLPMSQMIQKHCEDKSFIVTIYAIPAIMLKLRKHFGKDFVEPAHVPPNYVRGTIHINIKHSRVVKNYLTATLDESLLW